MMPSGRVALRRKNRKADQGSRARRERPGSGGSISRSSRQPPAARSSTYSEFSRPEAFQIANWVEAASSRGASSAASGRPPGRMRRAMAQLSGSTATPKTAPSTLEAVQVGTPRA